MKITIQHNHHKNFEITLNEQEPIETTMCTLSMAKCSFSFFHSFNGTYQIHCFIDQTATTTKKSQFQSQVVARVVKLSVYVFIELWIQIIQTRIIHRFMELSTIEIIRLIHIILFFFLLETFTMDFFFQICFCEMSRAFRFFVRLQNKTFFKLKQKNQNQNKKTTFKDTTE